MTVWGMLLGGFPRSKIARYALRDKERGLISYTDYTRVMLEIHSEIIGIQKANGFPVVVDGMVDWHDIFRPFALAWRNTSINGLLRFFDNNFFYRIPEFVEEPDIIEPVWASRVLTYKDLADPAKLKIVFPGPFTFTKMSHNKSDLSEEDLARAITNIIIREIELVKQFDVFIQIDEPLLSDRMLSKNDIESYMDLWNRIAKETGDRSILSIYFDAPSNEVYEALLDLRFRYISLDFIDTPERSYNLIREYGIRDHIPVLGVVDARRIHDDKLSEIMIKTIKRLYDESGEIVLTTSTWMDLIPYKYAVKKVHILSKLVNEVAKELGTEIKNIWR